jgi:DNA-binding winged helix-turn-helix (wHTH) protein/tetratricopeptide (TPR) repeat protein
MASFPPFRLDPVNQCLWRGDERIYLMPKPFAVLTYLVEHAGRLVTHEELLAALWPDTYVQPEVLRRYILEIRRVLGDSAEAPRFIQTLPKRGYQFVAPLTEKSEASRDTSAGTRATDAATPPASPSPLADPSPAAVRAKRARRVATGLLGALVLGGVVTFALFGTKSQALRERDWIVLAGFENRSGEPVFDFTLRQGLAAQLSQSPFLNIVPEERVRETLRLMGRKPDDRIGHDVALEVCRRQGVKALLDGSITRLGGAYVVALDATNCQTGEGIARDQVSVEGKERVLGALGKMASRLRLTLGESLASIERFDVPIEQITTPSLEALQAYTFGQRARARGAEIESIAFFQRAVELDPKFASAYASLSTVFSNLGEADRARQYARLAYEQRDQVSERERLSLTYQYYDQVSGDQARAIETLEVWKQSFPREYQPVNSLALIHNFLGNYERAVEEGQEAVRRNPSHGFPYSNLAFAYRGLGRFEEARRTAESAVALRIETLPTRRVLYQLALMAGDEQLAARQLEWARNNSREFDMVGARAQAAGFTGRLREARELYEETVRMAERASLRDVGTGHLAVAASLELTYGNVDRAAQQARRVLARNPSYDPKLRAALALAAAGFTAEAAGIADELSHSDPDHTFINFVFVPMVRASIELRRGHPERALEQLRIAAPYELGFAAALGPTYLRGQSYLMQGSGPHAAEEFQRILDHRGVDPFSPFYAVASLGLARARALCRDSAGSREAYEEFLAQWADADPDIPVLRQARSEHARLKRDPSTAGGHAGASPPGRR